MSRIGKLPVSIPTGVDVSLKDNVLTVKGPKGELTLNIHKDAIVEISDNEIKVTPRTSEDAAIWGTTRSLIDNMIVGVTEGYKKSLEINGVGYKFEVQGKKLILSIGYSHKVEMDVPESITVELDAKAKNILHVIGNDKQNVGAFASKIRSMKKPEPYKGKGIKYQGEQIRRKAGKTGAK